MIRSMTGFGREQAVVSGREIIAEIRSVNHKFFVAKAGPLLASMKISVVSINFRNASRPSSLKIFNDSACKLRRESCG